MLFFSLTFSSSNTSSHALRNNSGLPTVQWLRLCTSTAGDMVWFLVGEVPYALRCRQGKKKKKGITQIFLNMPIFLPWFLGPIKSVFHTVFRMTVFLLLLDAKLCPTLLLPRLLCLWVFKVRILEWVVISFSKGSSWPRVWTHVSCTGRQILYHWAPKASQIMPLSSYKNSSVTTVF